MCSRGFLKVGINRGGLPCPVGSGGARHRWRFEGCRGANFGQKEREEEGWKNRRNRVVGVRQRQAPNIAELLVCVCVC